VLGAAPLARAKLAELADALDSGSSGVTPVEVQVLCFAPNEVWFRFTPVLNAGARSVPENEVSNDTPSGRFERSVSA
jgi:hypothetical protein